MYAIIEDSGTQIKLQKGDVIDIDLRDADDGCERDEAAAPRRLFCV